MLKVNQKMDDSIAKILANLEVSRIVLRNYRTPKPEIQDDKPANRVNNRAYGIEQDALPREYRGF